MDSRLMLSYLVEKCRDILHNGREYIVCNQILMKINSLMATYKSGDVQLDLSEISSLTSEEISMFSSPECKRIVSSLKVISHKKGWRVETVFKLIEKLQQDILENKIQEFKKKEDSLDELSRIIDEGLFKDNYTLILDFIKICVDNKTLSVNDAINLNFYVLRECNVYSVSREDEDELEVVELQENVESATDIREKLQEIFIKYGYVYDEKKMGDLDSKFVKYANVSYVDYILSKFKEYGIVPNELYIRKRALYNIVIDNDRETFDSILDFINNNECSLTSLLGIPAIFAKRKKNYIERDKVNPGDGGNSFEVAGANKDFFENIALYKSLAGVSVIKDTDLDKLGKFLCTPSSLVNKNLLLLEKYGVIVKGTLPKAIGALCGTNTEYIIDRVIEAGLYESYLGSRVSRDGEVKQPRGTYFLDSDNSPFKFYKMKRANDLGQPILASNAGMRKVFRDNTVDYMGIVLKLEKDGSFSVVQEPLTSDVINGISPEKRKKLPEAIQHKIDEGRISESVVTNLYFNNLYKYTTFNPVEIFAASDKATITNLKGDRIAGVFKNDYKRVVTEDEMYSVEMDNFIKLLDNAIYCDAHGNSKPLKTTNLKYEFSHPSFPNIKVVISRYKVLRLCKLLKEEGCWINQYSSDIDKENTLLSVVIKDTIVSDTEMIVLRMAIRTFLADGMIKVPEIKVNTKDGRGAR